MGGVGSSDSQRQQTLALKNYKQLNKLQFLLHQQLSYSQCILHTGYSINIMEGWRSKYTICSPGWSFGRVFLLFDIVAQELRLCTFHRLVTWIYWQFCPGIYHHDGK